MLLVFHLLLLYLGNSQVSVYRTIGPTLVVFLDTQKKRTWLQHCLLLHSKVLAGIDGWEILSMIVLRPQQANHRIVFRLFKSQPRQSL